METIVEIQMDEFIEFKRLLKIRNKMIIKCSEIKSIEGVMCTCSSMALQRDGCGCDRKDIVERLCNGVGQGRYRRPHAINH